MSVRYFLRSEFHLWRKLASFCRFWSRPDWNRRPSTSANLCPSWKVMDFGGIFGGGLPSDNSWTEPLHCGGCANRRGPGRLLALWDRFASYGRSLSEFTFRRWWETFRDRVCFHSCWYAVPSSYRQLLFCWLRYEWFGHRWLWGRGWG